MFIVSPAVHCNYYNKLSALRGHNFWKLNSEYDKASIFVACNAGNSWYGENLWPVFFFRHWWCPGDGSHTLVTFLHRSLTVATSLTFHKEQMSAQRRVSIITDTHFWGVKSLWMSLSLTLSLKHIHTHKHAHTHTQFKYKDNVIYCTINLKYPFGIQLETLLHPFHIVCRQSF